MTHKRFSQFDEDLMTVPLVQKLNAPHMFLEIGCGNGSENNTRVLAEDLHWCGVWVDGEPENIQACRKLHVPGVILRCEMVNLENIPSIALEMPQEFGVLSIDVDGNDYHLWRALCEGEHGLKPYVVIIEAQIQKPHDEPYVMPYAHNYRWDNVTHDCGASIFSLVALGYELGYRYLGKLPEKHSPNLFFVRADLP